MGNIYGILRHMVCVFICSCILRNNHFLFFKFWRISTISTFLKENGWCVLTNAVVFISSQPYEIICKQVWFFEARNQLYFVIYSVTVQMI